MRNLMRKTDNCSHFLIFNKNRKRKEKKTIKNMFVFFKPGLFFLNMVFLNPSCDIAQVKKCGTSRQLVGEKFQELIADFS